MSKKRLFGTVLVCVVVLALLIFCFYTNARAGAPGDAKLKIALLPIIDSLPFYVAEAKGYFSEQRISVEAVPVFSGLERDQLMQAGAIDGMLNEMTTTANFNRERVQIKILCSVRKPHPQAPMFRILVSPKVGLSTVRDLARIPIGISKNTIIEYVTDRLLVAEGLHPNEIVKRSVPVIPERYQLLLQGQLKAATLPDPLAMSAMAAGARVLVSDSSYPEFSVSVLSFHVKSINDKAHAIRAFLSAWDKAVAEINSNSQAFHRLMLKKIRVPKNIQSTYQIPPFVRREVPSPSQWDDVMAWMEAKGLISSAISYESSITTEYLP